MLLETAKEILRKEIEYTTLSPSLDDIDFNFIGGEPLMAFPLIKEICEWAWEQNWHLPFIFYATTNGTLLNEEMKNWFRKHADKIVLGLSVDGKSGMQYLNRGCSSENLSIDFIYSCWPEQQFKMTISKETLPLVAEGVIYMHEKGLSLSTTIAQGVIWNHRDAVIYREVLNDLLVYYMEHSDVVPTALFTKNISKMFQPYGVNNKCCGSGDTLVTYDFTGKSYPCILFTPIVLGKDVSEEVSKFDFSDKANLVDPSCKQCPIVNLCFTCYGFNYKLRRNLALRDKSCCEMIFEEVKVACYYQKYIMQQIQEDTTLSQEEFDYLAMLDKAITILDEYSLMAD